MYYFDIGSSTIKLYEYKKELSLIEEKSIMFKRGFSEDGIQEENIEKSRKIEGVEQYINNFTDSNAYNSAKLLSGDDGYTYICSIDNIKISNTTRRVYEITFENSP